MFPYRSNALSSNVKWLKTPVDAMIGLRHKNYLLCDKNFLLRDFFRY